MRISDWSSDVCSSDLPDQHRTPGKSAANALHQDGIARFDAPVAASRIKSKRHAGGRGICVAINRNHNLVVGNIEPASQEVDNAYVSLMRHQPIDIFKPDTDRKSTRLNPSP